MKSSKKKIGIVGYGAYIPKFRIKVDSIADYWDKPFDKIKKSLSIKEKSVPNHDEDSATMAVEAAKNALKSSQIKKTEIGALYVGSESHPYAVKPTSSIVGSALDIGNNYTAADLEFACKAGTAAMQICYGLVKSEIIKYGLAIGSDTAQAEPGDILEYSAGAASAAFIIGNKKEEIIATIDKTISYTTDTPDFWRRNKEQYPVHTGRFTGEPSYFKHVIYLTKKIMSDMQMQPQDFDFAIFHQPNGRFPLAAAKKLGFTKEQVLPGLIASEIGNTYSACSPIALAAVLDIAKPNQKILLTSYGSGSGSDSFVLTTTELIEKNRDQTKKVKDYINNKIYLNYPKYRGLLEKRLYL